jgi:hypothetical protein
MGPRRGENVKTLDSLQVGTGLRAAEDACARRKNGTFLLFKT